MESKSANLTPFIDPVEWGNHCSFSPGQVGTELRITDLPLEN